MQKHLFIVIPNRSGSTFTENLLKKHSRVASLGAEGQHLTKGSMPNDVSDPHFWTKGGPGFKRKRDYDWPTVLKIWHKEWATHPNYSEDCILLEKSPPNVIRMNILIEQFPSAYYILGTRNPYAVCASIHQITKLKHPYRRCAIQAINVLKEQSENLKLDCNKIFFRYEDLCANPNSVRDDIVDMLPELEGLNFEEGVKGGWSVFGGMLSEKAQNRNEESISSLRPDALEEINKVFKLYPEIMEQFEYSYIEE